MDTRVSRINTSLATLLPKYRHLFENAKTFLFLYVFLTQTLKAYRHLRARGITTSIHELYTAVSQVCRTRILSDPIEFQLFVARHPTVAPLPCRQCES